MQMILLIGKELFSNYFLPVDDFLESFMHYADVNGCNFMSISFVKCFQSLIQFAATPDDHAHFITVCQVSIKVSVIRKLLFNTH